MGKMDLVHPQIGFVEQLFCYITIPSFTKSSCVCWFGPHFTKSWRFSHFCARFGPHLRKTLIDLVRWGRICTYLMPQESGLNIKLDFTQIGSLQWIPGKKFHNYWLLSGRSLHFFKVLSICRLLQVSPLFKLFVGMYWGTLRCTPGTCTN